MFSSEGVLQKVEYWFESILKHLNTMGVLEEYRIEFTAYKLEG